MKILVLVVILCVVSAHGSINIALWKPTFQSGPHNLAPESRLAVDGKSSTCIKTTRQCKPWWGLNLKKLYFVTYVKITSKGSLSGFNVYVGNHGKGGQAGNNLCAAQQSVKAGKTKIVHCNRNAVGKYVIIQVPKKASLHLCEVEVYGYEAVFHKYQYDKCNRRCKSKNGKLVECTRVRKDITSMTVEERKRYINAYKAISTKTPYQETYNKLVKSHYELFFTSIHKPHEFLPWHRWFILELENLLRKIDCRVTVPYYDWSVWSQDPFNTTYLWKSTDDGFGGNGVPPYYCVKDGPFGEKNWQVAPSGARNGNRCLRRHFNGKTPDVPAIELLLKLPPSMFKKFEESLRVDFHDRVHCIFDDGKGHMCSIKSAASPDFFLHHTFVDKLWNDWQRKSSEHKKAFFSKQTTVMRNTPYTAAQLYDIHNQPKNVRVEYDDPSHDQAKRVFLKLAGLSVKQLRNLPRAGFSPINQQAIALFHVSKKEQKMSRRFERFIAPRHRISASQLHGFAKILGFTDSKC